MLLGKEIGPFVVEKELGSGAMGSVFQGREKQSGKKVAIKMISMALSQNENALKRFKRESAILKQLNHPNIVRLLASGRFHNTPFYVMEYVEGESLDHVIQRRGRLTWEEVVELGSQLCAALQHAHEKGIIHRDLKPSNLMVLRDGVVKLTDFGIAKDTDVTQLTAANSTVGTAAYMSPEQCRGAKDITNKADLYSMGVMFYELLTGRKPFQAETTMEMFLQHANAIYIRPSKIVLDIPVWLDTLVCQLLEKKPENRPLDAQTVAEALLKVREKVAEQKSAGIDAATKRRTDRASTDKKLDELDKDVARALLGKKKKKKPTAKFYEKTWFTATALSILLASLLTFLFWVFFASPGADSLYAQWQAAKLSGTNDASREARRGPVEDFLRLYPNDPRVREVQDWADNYDVDKLESQMIVRLQIATNSDAEKDFRTAQQLEESGKLPEAAKLWSKMQSLTEKDDADVREWKLLATRRLKKISDAEKAFEKAKIDVHNEKVFETKFVAASALEQATFDAVKEESLGNMKQAEKLWEELRRLAENSSDHRALYLLARQRLRDLSTLPTEKPKKESGTATP